MLETLEVQVEGDLYIVTIKHLSPKKCIINVADREITLIRKRYAWRKNEMYGPWKHENVVRKVIEELERRERQKRYPGTPDSPDQTLEVVSGGKTYSVQLIELEERKFQAILTDDYRVLIYWNGVRWKVQGQGSRTYIHVWDQVMRELNRRELEKRDPQLAKFQKENPIEIIEVKVRGATYAVKVSPLEEGRYEATFSSLDKVDIFWDGEKWGCKGTGSKRNKEVWAAVVRKIRANR
ncbi:hypothetical protein M5X17_20520 [Paenibacillus alvei]|uniref:hypothetical protein n=1 Tax=Paenibacillus alvei TaxID=44250 RepID=UPI000287E487|nr:hypothetical protein [Paenibacillus alvei]EJW14344.1 hypothetical protein PAV_14c00370 [Paenibacillus alvei DSM 29]MCY9542841.1 hypothetical protein [Paenibacillus alvei]MCY9736104.1 hypothetical protein [Paenibacillus alvei]MEC0084475.1 hypothetical protein [Paenibacillus alvei]